jgi:hypothetical protein
VRESREKEKEVREEGKEEKKKRRKEGKNGTPLPYFKIKKSIDWWIT